MNRLLAAVVVTALGVTLAGCAKKVVAKAPPPAPQSAPAQPAPVQAATRPAPSTPVREASTTRPAMPDAATRAQIQDLLNRIQDAYFDYDKSTIRSDAQAALAADAKTLSEIIRQYPNYKLTIQGFCDERGSDEYNMALGDARAKQAKEFLIGLGLPGNQLLTVSFGKSRPVCTEDTESCWQKNRRTHITQEQSS
jgi:peptidoglycan-associated lipoprotein